MLEALTKKPFAEETELADLKTTLAKLEREISIKIQANKMAQQGGTDQNIRGEKPTNKAPPDIKDESKETVSLLPKKEYQEKGRKQIRI